MRPGEQLRIYLTPSKQLFAAEKDGVLFQVPQQTCTGGAALNGSYWPISANDKRPQRVNFSQSWIRCALVKSDANAWSSRLVNSIQLRNYLGARARLRQQRLSLKHALNTVRDKVCDRHVSLFKFQKSQ